MLRKLSLVGVMALFAATLASQGASGKMLATYDYNATGIETSVPTGNTSPFAGVAFGTGGFALWSAGVPHDSLDYCGATAIQAGGTFSLAPRRGIRLTGSFTGGSVTAPPGFCGSGGTPPCTNETFGVDGFLTLNGGAYSGEFKGSLTHYSTMIGSNCVTYFATISGHLSAG